MPRKIKPGTKIISFKPTEEQRKELESEARGLLQSISQVVRDRLFGKKTKGKQS